MLTPTKSSSSRWMWTAYSSRWISIAGGSRRHERDTEPQRRRAERNRSTGTAGGRGDARGRRLEAAEVVGGRHGRQQHRESYRGKTTPARYGQKWAAQAARL